jgi:hypothetical protein
MKIILMTRSGRELERWDSLRDFVGDLVSRAGVLEVGDQLLVVDDTGKIRREVLEHKRKGHP